MQKLINDFTKYVNEEYAVYPKLPDELISFARCLNDENKVRHFITYIKDHHNNAFSSETETLQEIEILELAEKIPDNAFGVLCQLIKGPTFDGDVISKNGKAWLANNNCCVRIVRNGEFGDNAATYVGWRIHHQKTKASTIAA